MVSNLEFKIRTDAVKIRSVRMTSEMKTFIYKNGRPDHMDGYHDDLLMAMAMCLWVVEHSFKNLERLEKQNKAMLSSWVVGSPSVKEEPASGSFVSKENRNKATTPKPKFNPAISKISKKYLSKYKNIFLVKPMRYEQFVYMLIKSSLVITDSGGIQEELSVLNKDTLIIRENTERNELTKLKNNPINLSAFQFAVAYPAA
jgi:hypothetical protein